MKNCTHARLLHAGIGVLVALLGLPGAHASGLTFTGPVGTSFEVDVGIESSEFDQETLVGTGPAVLTATAEVSEAAVAARGSAGTGRLVAEADADATFTTQGAGTVRWDDVITPSGADSYRFEFELVGDVSVGDLPSGAFPGSTTAAYLLGLNLSGDRSNLTAMYTAKAPLDSCPQGTAPAAGGCFEIRSERADIPFEITGTGDLTEGPVVIAFTPPHPESGGWDAEFILGANVAYTCCGIGSLPTGRAVLSVDLGTGDNYARFLGVTGATTAGMPDNDFSIVSASAYDYSQPAPILQALPEPGASLALGCALSALLALRLVRGPS